MRRGFKTPLLYTAQARQGKLVIKPCNCRVAYFRAVLIQQSDVNSTCHATIKLTCICQRVDDDVLMTLPGDRSAFHYTLRDRS